MSRRITLYILTYLCSLRIPEHWRDQGVCKIFPKYIRQIFVQDPLLLSKEIIISIPLTDCFRISELLSVEVKAEDS
jgi:hypothetical protein